MAGRKKKPLDEVKRKNRAYPYASDRDLRDYGLEDPREFPVLIRRLLQEHKDKLKQLEPVSREG